MVSKQRNSVPCSGADIKCGIHTKSNPHELAALTSESLGFNRRSRSFPRERVRKHGATPDCSSNLTEWKLVFDLKRTIHTLSQL